MSIKIRNQEYKIIKELGQGGFGKVYQVLNENENKYYAIKKILLKDLNEEQIETAENEANILSNITSEYIVKYYDSFKDVDSFNILMEYCEKDLKKFINEYKMKNELIDENVIKNIIMQLCLGIKEIHRKNLIHRDLKPENIFINSDNKIKIGDFGISKKLDINNKYAHTSIGTNIYMSPEMIKGEQYNNKVDIWALGCIIYELFTLNACFESKSLFGFVNKILNEKHGKIDLNKYNNKWQNLIDLLLKKKYKERPNIDEVYELLNKERKEEIIQKNDNKGKKMIRLSRDEFENLKKNGDIIYYMSSKKYFYNFIFIFCSISIRKYMSRKNKLN